VIGACEPNSEITISPQFVVSVKVLASDLAATVGCFTVAGVCPLAVLLAHPGTEVGRVAACAGVRESRPSAQVVNSAIAVVLFIIEFLFPFNRARWLTCDIYNDAVYLTNFIGNTR
jgi:hypothetical protein